MRTINTPNGTTNPLDIVQIGRIRDIVIAPDTDFLFPPADEFPDGGAFILVVPADVDDLECAVAGDGAELGIPIFPGIGELAADKFSEYILRSATGCTIRVAARKES